MNDLERENYAAHWQNFARENETIGQLRAELIIATRRVRDIDRLENQLTFCYVLIAGLLITIIVLLYLWPN